MIDRATILADQHEITLDDLPREIAQSVDTERAVAGADSSESAGSSAAKPVLGSQDVKVDELAKAHVLDVLAKEGGNKARAARKVSIHRRKLYRLLERWEQETPVKIS